MKQIKFHYKKKPFSCGPCALRMILETLLDVTINEEILIELLGTTEDIGSPLAIFQKNLSFLLDEVCLLFKIDNHFEFLIKEGSYLKELQHLQNENYLIMLNYKKPAGQSHWAVLNNIDQKNITLMDPDFGPNFKYELNQFNWAGRILIPTTKALIALRYKS